MLFQCWVSGKTKFTVLSSRSSCILVSNLNDFKNQGRYEQGSFETQFGQHAISWPGVDPSFLRYNGSPTWRLHSHAQPSEWYLVNDKSHRVLKSDP